MTMSNQKRIDLRRVKTISVVSRASKVSHTEFARPFNEADGSFRSFIRTLPDILVARDLRALVNDVITAKRKKKPVILMMGAHVVKVGVSPVIVDLIRRGFVTHVAMNGAAAIHDVESAIWGKTSEDVASAMESGKFGMARETGEFINGTLTRAYRQRRGNLGYGEALGKRLNDVQAPNRETSILAVCAQREIPATVHAAIGTDIIHQQPSMNGAATGELSMRDFRALCATCCGLTGGGVVLNVGSAVIMPEVFLKALTVARNVGAKARGFTTAVFDMKMHYRPTMNVRLRPTQNGGRGYAIIGHHEIMMPLFAAMIISESQR